MRATGIVRGICSWSSVFSSAMCGAQELTMRWEP
uniref:Uncharacterized protein n=1 Tax=Arundo donax TaxID=35708 RepID=A0A0A9BH77_ARUDO